MFYPTAEDGFFDEAVPEFYLNSPKWVALENERRNLIAQSYPFSMQEVLAFNKLHARLVLGNPADYFTLEQFGERMTAPYKEQYGALREAFTQQAAVSMQSAPLVFHTCVLLFIRSRV